MADLNDVVVFLMRLDERFDALDRTAVKNTAVLEEHMRRSDAIEARVEQVATDLEPLKKHVAMWAGVGKGLAVGGTAVSVITGVLKLLGVV